MSGKGFSPDPPQIPFGLKIDPGPAPVDPNAADRLLSWKELLEKALAAHTTGRFDEAERLYRLVLEKDAREPNALTNIGTIFLQRGQLEEGINFINASLEVKPNQAHALANLGNALNSLRRFDEALDACERAVALQPGNYDAYNNMGNILRELERPDEALAAYDQAFALKPDFALVLNNKGILLRHLGRTAEALAVLDQALLVQSGNAQAQYERGNVLVDLNRAQDALATFEQAILLNPHYAEAWSNKAVALQMLKRPDEALAASHQAIALSPAHPEALFVAGNILRDLKREEEAAAFFERAIAARPDYADAFNNLGNALQALGRWDEALVVYERALDLRKDLAPAFGNRGFVLRDMGRYEEALAAYDQALALDPGFLDAINNRALILNELRRVDEAVAVFDQAAAIDPTFVDVQWNKAIVLILNERYAEGWPLYEWRWRRKDNPSDTAFLEPDWLHKAQLAGKTIVVRAEQGLGDTLNMIRYARLLADLGARVVMAVQTPLGEIASAVRGVSQVIVEGETLPPHDLSCMIMSLPFAFGTTVDTIPAQVPYLYASEASRAKWAARLGPRTRPRIGLAWSGNPGQANDRNRTAPLAALLPLLDADADFFSLQIEYRDADRALLEADGRIRRFDGEIKSFMDTAGLVEQMDLVISVCTSVAHLAGGLGKPLWVLLSHSADYRWHVDRQDSPWYPTARLFRQPKFADWTGLVRQVGEALTDLDASIAALTLPVDAAREDAGEAARREAAIAVYNRNRALTVLRNRSAALAAEGRLDEALTVSEQTLAQRPDSAEAHFDVGTVLARLKRPAEAELRFARAVALRPDYVEALNDLGLAQRAQGRSAEALATFERARDIKPDLAPLYGNLGNALQDLGRHDEALAAFDRAIVLNPDYADARWNKALLYILTERHAEAWPLYEWRWRRDGLLSENIDFLDPEAFSPANLAGKTVLVRAEQGLGDTLQMLRYAPLLSARGATVILSLQASLREIGRGVDGVSQVIVEGETIPPHDILCMMMSLPYAFATTIDTIPAEVPYVRATDEARAAWGRRLGPRTRPRIGLAWSGNPAHNNDAARSLPLDLLAPLLDLDADFVSLQVDYRDHDLALLDADGRIRRFDGELKSFMDTAALIDGLDLVISVDTSVAHLAGALGKPLWLLLPHRPDYRWHLDREDTPWYPTARLLRQPRAGDWLGVVDRVRRELAAKVIAV